MHKILVVDDVSSIILAIGHILMDDYDVLVATSGEDALRCAEQEFPDLILLDIQMPEMNGLEAIRHLRTMTATAQTPIIAVTALVMPGDRERCIAAGADHYISKPINLSEMLDLLERTTS